MGIIVPFVITDWRVGYPEFVKVADPQIEIAEGIAEAIHANDGSGPVASANVQKQALWAITAHVAFLNYGYGVGSSAPANTIVGRISSATEGSVSVTTENNYPAGTPQWFQQTKYGSTYFMMMAPYRTMRYFARPQVVVDGAYPAPFFGPIVR